MAVDQGFKRARQDKFTRLQDSLAHVTDTIGIGGDIAQRKEAAKRLNADCVSLTSILNPSDRPEWLQSLEANSGIFVNEADANSGKRLLRSIVTYSNDVKPLGEDGNEYAFDLVFQSMADSVTEQFDKLAAEMQRILDSGEIEQSSAEKTLEKMVAALKANQKGSFVSVLFTAKFVKYGWRICREGLGTVGLILQMATNVDKLMDENDDMVQSVETAIGVAARKAAEEITPKNRHIAEGMPDLPRLPGN